MHFIRLVTIRRIRFYVDYNEDESYTPTRIRILAGTGWHDLIPLTEMFLERPEGWQDVPLAGAGAGPDENSLACWIFQLVILENHQNGKDTHIRGLKVYALDEGMVAGAGTEVGLLGPVVGMAVPDEASHTYDDHGDEGGANPAPGSSSNTGNENSANQHGVNAAGEEGDSTMLDLDIPPEATTDHTSLLQWVRSVEEREGGSRIHDFQRDPEIR